MPNPSWVKGGPSPNPGGQGKLPPALKAVKLLTPKTFARVFSKFAEMPKAEMDEVIRNPNTSVLELAVCSAFYSAITKGDFKHLTWMLDRVLGKIPEKAQSEIEQDLEKNEIAKLTDSELLERAKLAVIEMESK